MFSRILLSKKNLSKINTPKRNLYWIKNNKDVFSLGIQKQTINNYGEIIDIYINFNRFIKKGEELILFETKNFKQFIVSPYDCEIISTNNLAKRYINTIPENYNKSWIVKFLIYRPEILIDNYAHQNYNIPIPLVKYI